MRSLPSARLLTTALAALCIVQSACTAADSPAPVTTADADETLLAQANDPNMSTTRVKLDTTQGPIVIEVHPEWAPNGAKRFLELVENDFYDGVKFFRVIDGFMAQTGMNGDPATHGKWKDNNIPDDPVQESNLRGYVTFAQTSAPNSRSTQFFINYGDNSFLDGQRFAPFGRVVEGMENVDKLYKGYGESPDQFMIIQKGNEYLNKTFPKLDEIKSAEIVEE